MVDLAAIPPRLVLLFCMMCTELQKRLRHGAVGVRRAALGASSGEPGSSSTVRGPHTYATRTARGAVGPPRRRRRLAGLAELWPITDWPAAPAPTFMSEGDVRDATRHGRAKAHHTLAIQLQIAETPGPPSLAAPSGVLRLHTPIITFLTAPTRWRPPCAPNRWQVPHSSSWPRQATVSPPRCLRSSAQSVLSTGQALAPRTPR